MKLLLLLRMSWRNLWRHTRRTVLTALAFTFGVFLLVISLGLGDGMHEKMIETGIRLGSGHIVLEPHGARATVDELHYLDGDEASRAEAVLDRAEIRDHVRGTAPRLLASGLISSATNSTGVQIVGGLPEREREVGLLPEKITDGDFLAEEGRAPPAVIGDGLARKLGVDLGSKVVLMTQAGSEIQSQLLRVRGIFSTGMSDVDHRLVAVRLHDLQKMIQRPGAISNLAVFLDNSEESSAMRDEIAARIRDSFGSEPPSVLTWRQAMPELAQFIVVDDAGNYLFNGVLLFMVSLGVLNTILMAVLERRREFSLLLALGMRPREITTVVVLESMLLTALGAGSGLLLGWGAHRYFATHGLDFSSLMDQSFSVAGVSIDTVVYSYLYEGRIEWTLAYVFLLGLGASLYPALRAAHTDPTEATKG
jgi:ABC-type lipoprotein release transport system permease subunit